MLWMCIQFPELSLETNDNTDSQTEPMAIYQTNGQQQVIVTSNKPAKELGIYTGMSLMSARQLCHQLRATERQPEKEKQHLQTIAHWALQYSSDVCVGESNHVLIEIEASLQLFGGLDKICESIIQDLQQQDYFFHYGIAPTPCAAELLAKANRGDAITSVDEIAQRISPLPLSYFDLENDHIERLRGIGLRTIKDVLQLQRSAVNRRLGAAFGIYLEKLLGTRPDIRKHFVPPTTFRQTVEFSMPVDNAEALLFSVKRLLNALHGFLRAQGAGIQQLNWILGQGKNTAQDVRMGLASLQRDPNHLYQLAKERFNQIALNAPVHELTLHVDQHFPLEHKNHALFPQWNQDENEDWQRLFERLRARLDDNAIQQLSLYADHRPERANQFVSPIALRTQRQSPPTLNVAIPKRPLWLLPTPSPLPMREQQPYYYGLLTLIAGPERIESGWWDHYDVQRDYYVAQNQKGILVWIFRSLDSRGGWFLHGIF